MHPPRWTRALPVTISALLLAQVTVVAWAQPGTPSVGAGGGPSAVAPASSGGAVAPTAQPTAAFEVSSIVQQVVEGTPIEDLLPVSSEPRPRCGAGDRPERGLQGDVPLPDQLTGRAADGYNCGIDVVGYSPLGGRGANGNMAWAGDCAYIAGEGVAVVDVSDPSRPRHVRTLSTPGSLDTLETLAAGTHEGRSILVAGRYGLFLDFQLAPTAPVDIYDVTDCANPRLLTTFEMPSSVHNLTLSADLTRMWSTLPLQALDITDPAHPRYLGNLEEQLRADGTFHLEYSHEVTISPDDRRLYIGGQVLGDEGSLIVDVEGWPQRRARVVADYSGPGHSIDQATIGGQPFLLRSEESVVPPLATSCLPSILTPFGGVAEAFLTSIGDEAHPVDRGTLSLEINRPEHCADALVSGVATSSHYHDVDDPTDTTFAMVSMWNAGLRIFDVRDPDAPREVAYFNPGAFTQPTLNSGGAPLDFALNVLSRTALDVTWSHVRYQRETGRIWVATRSGGFWVLQLQPQIREQLGLPAMTGLSPLAGSPRPAASRGLTPPTLLDPVLGASLYCTLDPVRSVL